MAPSTEPIRDVLLRLERDAATGILEVSGEGLTGRVIVHQGQPWDASTSDGHTGEAAVRRLLRLSTATSVLVDAPHVATWERLVHSTFTTILSSRGPISGRFTPASVRVFALDDDPAMLRFVKLALEAERFEVVTATVWSEIATSVLRPADDRTTVVISDLQMPGIRGEEFCAIVRRYNPGAIIIILTGTPEAVKPGLADAVVAKSAGTSKLIEQVRMQVAARARR